MWRRKSVPSRVQHRNWMSRPHFLLGSMKKILKKKTNFHTKVVPFCNVCAVCCCNNFRSKCSYAINSVTSVVNCVLFLKKLTYQMRVSKCRTESLKIKEKSITANFIQTFFSAPTVFYALILHCISYGSYDTII